MTVTVNNAVLWNVTPYGFCVRTAVSEERITSIIRVKDISQIRKMSAVTAVSYC
jgi:hypothetical protein